MSANTRLDSDIILLDPQGRVLARLDDAATTVASTDPVIREAIETRAGYVESFRVSDLVPNQRPALIYAFRVTDNGGRVLGVLCLCFRFLRTRRNSYSPIWSTRTIGPW